MRTSWRRTWIKLYPVDCLDGSIRYQLESDERGVWYDLLNFSAICATAGVISDKDNRAFPHSFIANRLNVSLELLERTLDKCKEEGRIDEDSAGIHIVNWAAYQSEYERQKPYRQKPVEKVEAERGAMTEYTYEMFCKDEDDITAQLEQREQQGETLKDVTPWIASVLFFEDRYGMPKSQDYSTRFLDVICFIHKKRAALSKEGLVWKDKATGKEVVEEELIKVILDSFSCPKLGSITSTFGNHFHLSYAKILAAVRPLLKE